MKRGTPKGLQYTQRHGHLTAAHSIQDFYDLVVELLTNADDSYHQLYADGKAGEDGGTILLEVEPHRGNTPSVVRVRDRAAGFANLIRKIERVGEKTSRSGDRGFMARGLKDCAAVGHITVETIVDGIIDKAEITPAFEVVPYAPSRKGGDRPTDTDRRRLGIARRGSGTVVEVALEDRVKVPRLETLRRELPWHYALRDITRAGGPSKVLLRYSDGEAEQLVSVEPDSELVYDRVHTVPGYVDHTFRFRLWKAQSPLEPVLDRRCSRAGMVLKGRRGIYGCSFLTSELERDPAADRYFGRIECEGIDVLAEEWDERRGRGERHPAENPTFILDPNRRGGVSEDHPFIKALFVKPIEVLREEFEKERQEREKKRQDVESQETTARLKKLAREASRFMREQLEDLGAVTPGDVVDDKSFHKTGVGVSPVFTQIPVGSSKAFTVKADNDKLDLPPGTVVKVALSKAAEQAVEVVGSPSELEPDPIDPRLLRGSFTLRGLATSKRVQVGCVVDGLDPIFVELQVIPAEPIDLEIPDDFAFHRKEYSVRQGGRRTLVLRARFDGGPPSQPRFRLADPSAAVLREASPFELVPGTTYYEATFTLEGRKPSGRTQVVAEVAGHSASCGLRVAEKEEAGVDLKFRLVDHDLGANYRAVWDRKEPNTLLITTRHESIRRYLGAEAKQYPGQNGEAFRVLLAELVADNVCRRIVEEYARAQPHDFDSDKVYLLHNRLMKQFTPIAHQVQLASPTIPG